VEEALTLMALLLAKAALLLVLVFWAVPALMLIDAGSCHLFSAVLAPSTCFKRWLWKAFATVPAIRRMLRLPVAHVFNKGGKHPGGDIVEKATCY